MSPTSRTPTTPHPLDHQEQVRRRAYELYEQSGKDDGHDLEHWLQAESEFPQPKAKAARS